MVDFDFLPDSIIKCLRPHQIAPVKSLCRILTQHGSAADFSDTGTGKTFVAVATAAHLGLPCLAVVPKISITTWHRAAEHFGDKLSVVNYESLRTGHTPYGSWVNQDAVDRGRESFLVCEICQQKVEGQICPHHPLGIHCVRVKKKPIRYGDFLFHPAVRMVLFDEAHRCGGLDSINADLLIGAKRQGIKTLCLSATAAASPLQFRALGYALDLFKLPDYYQWSARLGCRRHPAFRGWHWLVSAAKQKQVMSDLRKQIIPSRGVRITTDEIPGFPERDISAELYDVEKPNEIDSLHKALAQLENNKRQDADPENPLTKRLRLRQKIEILKIPIAVEIAQDALEKGQSVGIFVNFTATLKELARRLDCPAIDGGVTGIARQQIVDDFQANQIRCLVLNIAAGGISISLHDLDGEHPRVGFVMPGESAVDLIQVFGRFHREGAKSKCHYRVILAAGTVETKIFSNVNRKRGNIAALNDGDLVA